MKMARVTSAFACVLWLLAGGAASAGEQDCGAFALRGVLSVLGEERTVESLRPGLGITPKEGTSMLKIDELARSMGYKTEAVRLLPADLLKMKRPAVAFVRGHHFVSVVAVDSERQEVLIIDEGKSPEWLSLEEFKKQWKGHLLIVSPQKSTTGPKLWKHSDTVSVGRLLGVTGEKRSFTLLNTGGQDLRISSPRFSCDCAKVRFEPEVIPPGGICRVELTIDASVKPMGPFNLTLLFSTNEGETAGEQTRHRIYLTGEVERRAQIFPSYFSLGDIAPGQAEVKLASKLFLGSAYKGAVPTIHETQVGAVRGVAVKPAKEGPGAFDIEMVLDLKKVVCDADGKFFHDAFIRTADENYPYIQVGATGRRLPWVTAFPAKVLLTDAAPGTPVERTVRVVNRSGGPIQVSADADWVRAGVEGETVRLSVTPPEQAMFRTVVRVSGGGETIEIPIVGVARLAEKP